MDRLLVISPVRNEIAHIDRVVEAMAAQSRRPDVWVIVDDGSDDGTTERLRQRAADLRFIRLVEMPRQEPGVGDRLVAAAAPKAFNAGLAAAEDCQDGFVAKLDGDVELPENWYAELLPRFDADPRLGIAGGDLIEPKRGDWKLLPIPQHHVHGALKLYRRECFDQIGGVRECLGWDTIDETYARMHGWETRSFSDLVGQHHRPSGSAQGRLRGRARHGRCAYIAHFAPSWVLLRSLKIGLKSPPVLSAIAFVYGYVAAAVRRVPRVEDPEFRRFVRSELRGRLLSAIRLRPA